MPRVLVTGASGLVGSHAAELFAARGWAVRALVRATSDRSFLQTLDCELRNGDIERPASLAGCADDCDVVVHAAARLGSSMSWGESRTANEDGTRNVVAESLASGVYRFVHVSTVAVYGHPADHPERPITEDSPTDLEVPATSVYERSKRLAETVVRAVPADRMEWVVIRPAVIVGERDRLFTPRLVKAAARGWMVLPGGGRQELPVVYAGSVALACWLAATLAEANGQTYNLADDGSLTLRRMLEIASPPGRPLRVVAMPRSLFLGAFDAVAGLARLLPRAGLPVNARNAWFMAHDDPFSSARVRSLDGWRPRVSTEEGWRRAVHWYRESAADPAV